MSAKGTALLGTGGIYGAVLRGRRAPLRLPPSTEEGPPRDAGHQTGEFYVDKNGDLFYFKSPGWFKVQLTPA